MKTNLYLIIGDPFLRAQRSRSIAAEIEKKIGGTLDHQSFRLEETPLEIILSSARTLPFLAQGQVFSIRSAERLKAADLELLGSYLENPATTTSLVFETDAVEGSTEIQKFIKSKGQVILLAKQEARSAAQTYLQKKLSYFKKTMSPAAKTNLLEMCGEAVVFLDSMLDRLIQFSGESEIISDAMVKEFEEKWTDVTVFQLTNALLARDREKAVRTFRELMEDYGADLVSLIGILHWQLRSLWQGAALLESGLPESTMMSRLKVPMFRQRSLITAIRVLGPEKLEKALEALYQLDKGSKSGKVEGVPGLESWLMEYAGN